MPSLPAARKRNSGNVVRRWDVVRCMTAEVGPMLEKGIPRTFTLSNRCRWERILGGLVTVSAAAWGVMYWSNSGPRGCLPSRLGTPAGVVMRHPGSPGERFSEFRLEGASSRCRKRSPVRQQLRRDLSPKVFAPQATNRWLPRLCHRPKQGGECSRWR
jgi:hypothetical protein